MLTEWTILFYSSSLSAIKIHIINKTGLSSWSVIQKICLNSFFFQHFEQNCINIIQYSSSTILFSFYLCLFIATQHNPPFCINPQLKALSFYYLFLDHFLYTLLSHKKSSQNSKNYLLKQFLSYGMVEQDERWRRYK